MHRFQKSPERWWQKPLATVGGREIPAEIAVLRAELRPGERGAWLNSRGTVSGVSDVIRGAEGKFKTVRTDLPSFVAAELEALYDLSGVRKGAADLVVWNEAQHTFRLVEVKCPHWDRLTREQIEFLRLAEERGIATAIVEWEFSDHAESPTAPVA